MVAIPESHGKTLVTHKRHYLKDITTRLRKSCTKRVPQVVEPKVFNPHVLTHRMKGFFEKVLLLTEKTFSKGCPFSFELSKLKRTLAGFYSFQPEGFVLLNQHGVNVCQSVIFKELQKVGVGSYALCKPSGLIH